MNILNDLPQKLTAAILKELEPGESVRWCEQPVKEPFSCGTIFACFAGCLIIFCSVLVCIFSLPLALAIFWEIPLIGIGLVLYPYWSYLKASHTAYFITDRRAIVISGVLSVTIQTYSLAELSQTVRRERPNGTGDLIFAQRVGHTAAGSELSFRQGFFNIRSFKDAENRIRELDASQETHFE